MVIATIPKDSTCKPVRNRKCSHILIFTSCAHIIKQHSYVAESQSAKPYRMPKQLQLHTLQLQMHLSLSLQRQGSCKVQVGILVSCHGEPFTCDDTECTVSI